MFFLFFILFVLSTVAFFVSVIKPGLILRNSSGRKRSLLVFGVAALVLFILALVTVPTTPNSVTQVGRSKEETNQAIQGAFIEKAKELSSTPTPTLTPTPTPDRSLVKVIKVIDGDTIQIEGGKTIRYIGIDTPETVDPRQGIQCYGAESSAKNKELVEGKMVKLEKDISETDRYNRQLRYIYIGDTFINLELVKGGYAYASNYPPDVRYQDKFREAEQEARNNNRGLWAGCSNSGSVPSASTYETVGQIEGSSQPAQQLKSGSSGNYSCGSKKYCSQMTSCDEAYFYMNSCGLSRLDGDSDGVPCESLCR